MTDDFVKMERRMWEAYAKQAGGVSFDGQPLPTWDELGEERQSCWIATASVAADRIEELENALGALWWGVSENGAPDELLAKTKDALKGTKYE